MASAYEYTNLLVYKDISYVPPEARLTVASVNYQNTEAKIFWYFFFKSIFVLFFLGATVHFKALDS